MKKFKYLIVLCTVFILAFVSCKKETTPTADPVTYKDPIIEVNLDGGFFSESCSYSASGFYSFTLKSIENVGPVEYKFSIRFPNTVTVGTHSIDNNDYLLRLNSWNSSTSVNTIYESTSGTIKITTYDERNGIIEGTFSGVITDTDDSSNNISCTNGKFYGLF